MEDHFDREIKEGDLVVSKPTGRDSRMSHGLAVGKGSVRFSGGGVGGSADQVLIPTEDDPAMKKIQEDLVAKFKALDEHSAKEAKARKASRLKKWELVRFGVYSMEGCSTEVILGPCVIQGKEYGNAWLALGRLSYSDPASIENMRFPQPYTRGWYGTERGGFRFTEVRDVKYPSKDKEHFVYKRETLEDILNPMGVKLL